MNARELDAFAGASREQKTAPPERPPEQDDGRESLDVEVTTGRNRVGEPGEQAHIVPPEQRAADTTPRPEAAGGGPVPEGEPDADGTPASVKSDGDTGWTRGIRRGSERKAQALSPSDWDQLIRRHLQARDRLTPAERRAVDEYYRRLRDLR